MAKRMGCGGKILLLRQLLLDRTGPECGVTMAEILSYLSQNGIEAERKSIYADLELLRASGMDIGLERCGKRREYRVLSRTFDTVELKLLTDAVAASRFITRKKSGELIEKLRSLTSESERRMLRRQVYVDGRIKSMNETIYYSTDAISEAIEAGRMIRFRYYDYTPEKKRVARRGVYIVAPLGLVVCSENYYLCAYSEVHADIRNYRVDRMGGVEVLDRKRPDLPEVRDFDLVSYRERQFSMFGGEQRDVTIEFDDALANVAVDYFGPDVPIRPRGDGRFTVTRRIEVSPAFFGWLFQFGTRCRLLAPADVAAQYAGLARAVAAGQGEEESGTQGA